MQPLECLQTLGFRVDFAVVCAAGMTHQHVRTAWPCACCPPQRLASSRMRSSRTCVDFLFSFASPHCRPILPMCVVSMPSLVLQVR